MCKKNKNEFLTNTQSDSFKKLINQTSEIEPTIDYEKLFKDTSKSLAFELGNISNTIAKNINESFVPEFERLTSANNKIKISEFSQFAASISDSLAPEIEKVTAGLSDAFKPINIYFEKIYAETQKIASEIAKPFVMLKNLGENQFVYWDWFDNDFCNEVLSTDDINNLLFEYYSQDNFKRINETIDRCKHDSIMKSYSELFSQAIICYQNKQYNISILGLIAIADSILSEVTQNETHRYKARVERIKEELLKKGSYSPEDFSLIALYFTFRHMMDSFYKTFPFDGPEPELLNRNWLMHGRSRKDITQLDCIKIINYLFGLILFNKSLNE